MGAGTVHGFWCSSEQQLGWGESASTLPSQTLQWSNQLSLHKTGISQSQKLHGRRRICPWPAWHGYHPSTLVPGMVSRKASTVLGSWLWNFDPGPWYSTSEKSRWCNTISCWRSSIMAFLAFRSLQMWDISSYSPGGTDSDGADVCRGELSGPRVPWRASSCSFFFRSEQLIILLWGMCSKNICYGHLWTMIWMWLWNVMNIFLAFYKLMVI